MFVQLDPATHQEREYDDGSTPMEELTFENLDANEWCKAAKAFGAKEIVFMLAHSGGFCMWPSSTTNYHIGNTPYKGGNGDVVKDFAQACRDNGLNAGFYLWAPHQADTQLHHGCWHMRPSALENRKSVDELMDCYIKSVGRNSFLILNCAPMPDGSVHPDDMKRYEEFGAEIERRFGSPLATVTKVPANEVILELDKPSAIGYTDLSEAYQYGQRVRAYEIEGYDVNLNEWIPLAAGTSVGKRKIDVIDAPNVFSKLKAKITSSVGTPLISQFQVHAK